MEQIGPMPVYTHTGVIDQRITGSCFEVIHQVRGVVVTGEEKLEQTHPEEIRGEHDTVDFWGTTKSVAIQNPSTSRSEDNWLNRHRKDTVIPSLDCACDGGKYV